MRARRHNLDIVFRKIPPEQVIKGIQQFMCKPLDYEEVSYRKIPKELFVNLAGWSGSGYSKDEREEQYNLLIEDMHKNYADIDTQPSVFNLLYKFAKNVLRTDRFVPVCKYSEILKWQDTSHYLGQDLFTTAFVAANDCKDATITDFFAWDPIIRSTNSRLTKLLNQGIAENHYHLNGSSQCFPLTWVSIMNYPELVKEKIGELDNNLQNQSSFGYNYNVVPWEVRLFWAASIRVYLFKTVNGIVVKKQKNDDNYICSDSYKLEQRLCTTEINEISVLISDLKSELERLQYSYALRLPYDNNFADYAVLKTVQQKNLKYNRILVGERQFMYDCFRRCFNNGFSAMENNLFYAYLLIKSSFRGEFIQINNDVGFKNFEVYQDRKLIFPEQEDEKYDVYKDEVFRLALNSTLHSQPIKSLEARIMPGKEPSDLVNKILKIDEIFDTCNDKSLLNFDPSRKNQQFFSRDDKKYFFVIHYPKGKFMLEKDRGVPRPRNYAQRERNKVYTLSLMTALESDKYMRDAIKGIDACANEIGCRPEVFARDFRLLRKVIPQKKRGIYGTQEMPVQLGVTYHAGEDFLNITDGLRAIDEAVHFISLRHGDRLGHALALGIDVRQYYKSKNNRIIMPKQDVLDDDVWLLYRAYEFNIPVETALERSLLSRIEDHIRFIYGDVINRMEINWSAHAYFCSWKLRGDYPGDYFTGVYKESEEFTSPYYNFNKNHIYPEFDFRSDKDIAKLYYAYHFDYNAKKSGRETEVIKITPDYISLVEAVQNKMRYIIAQKGIMIECNPSSNCLIGTFDRYDEHPITTFNNMGLEFREDKVENCAQICVSINTDDQGIFDTSLINEYAVIASSLEQKKDINGKNIYSPEHVYQYIDNVRKMGLEQSFNTKNET